MSKRHIISLAAMETNEGRKHDFVVKMVRAAKALRFSPDQFLQVLSASDQVVQFMLQQGRIAAGFALNDNISVRVFPSLRIALDFSLVIARDHDLSIEDLVWFIRSCRKQLRLPTLEESCAIRKDCGGELQSLVLNSHDGTYSRYAVGVNPATTFGPETKLRMLGTTLPFLVVAGRSSL